MISFRACHPFFVRWLFPVRAARGRAAYRLLYGHLEAALDRRLRRVEHAGTEEGGASDVLGTLADLVERPADGKPGWGRGECVEELISLVAGGTDAMSYTVVRRCTSCPVTWMYRMRRGLGSCAPGGAADPFVMHVLHETMRLDPAVPFSSKYSETRSLDVRGASASPRKRT